MKKAKKNGAAEIAREIANEMQSKTDPQGSWTGKPEAPTEKPVQDADDL